MSTLKKEREAIVNRLHKARLDRFGEHTTIGEDRYLKDFINEVVVPALIPHEEKVLERVRENLSGVMEEMGTNIQETAMIALAFRKAVHATTLPITE